MSLREFKNKYFEDWRIAGISTYGNERGYIKLRDKDSFIKLYFKFNGAKHWTDDCVALDYIEGCDMDQFANQTAPIMEGGNCYGQILQL